MEENTVKWYLMATVIPKGGNVQNCYKLGSLNIDTQIFTSKDIKLNVNVSAFSEKDTAITMRALYQHK